MALRLASGTLVSRVLGFVRDALMAAFFSRAETDAWLVAFRLPNFIRRVVMEGAFSSSLTPALLRAGASGDPLMARNLVGASLVLAVMCAGVFCLAVYLNAEGVICLLAAGYCGPADLPRDQLVLTAELLRLMLPYVMALAAFAVLGAVHQSDQRFGRVSLAPALCNLAVVVVALLAGFFGNQDIQDVAWAVSWGGALQLLAVGWGISRSSYWPPEFGLSKAWEGLRGMAGFAPSAFVLAVPQLGFLFNTYKASLLPVGSNSYLFWSDRLLELPLALVGMSFGVTLLPTMTQMIIQKTPEQALGVLVTTARKGLLLIWPAVLAGSIWAPAIVSLLFERGEFTASDRESTASLFMVSSLALPGLVLCRWLGSYLLSHGKNWTSGFCGLGGLAAQVLFVTLWFQPLGLMTLPWGWVAGSYFQLLLMLVCSAFLPGWSFAPWRRLVTTSSVSLVAGSALIVVVLEAGLQKWSVHSASFESKAIFLSTLIVFSAAYLLTFRAMETED